MPAARRAKRSSTSGAVIRSDVVAVATFDCVVFDLDGCLIRSNVFKQQAYVEIFEHLGADLVARALREAPDGDRFVKIRRVLELANGDSAPVDPVLVTAYADRYNDLCQSFAIACDEVPGAGDALRRLAGRFVLYVNSATPEAPLRAVVAGRGWSGLFREVLGGQRSKADNLRHILRRESIPPDRLVFVGDERRDQAAAATCGSRFIGLRNPESNFEAPVEVEFDNMSDLSRYLLRGEWKP